MTSSCNQMLQSIIAAQTVNEQKPDDVLNVTALQNAANTHEGLMVARKTAFSLSRLYAGLTRTHKDYVENHHDCTRCQNLGHVIDKAMENTKNLKKQAFKQYANRIKDSSNIKFGAPY